MNAVCKMLLKHVCYLLSVGESDWVGFFVGLFWLYLILL